jgi:hypothetical protein
MPRSVSWILHSVWNHYIISSVSIPTVRKNKKGRYGSGYETEFQLLDFVDFTEDPKYTFYSDDKDIDGLEI